MLRATRDPVRRIAVLWRDELATLLRGPRRLALAGRIGGIWLIETVALLAVAAVLQGVAVEGPLAALILVVVLQVLYAALRPVVVYLLLPLLVLTGGLLGLVVNALLLMAADAIVPWTRIDGFLVALATVVVLSSANLLVTAFLDLRSEAGFYRSVERRMVRRGRPVRRQDRPGIVFVQVDGLGHDVLAEAVRTGRMPTVARWLRDGSHALHGWECALPSQTSASQAGLLFGDNAGIPAFRWYEKERARLLVSNRPADATEMEHRLSTGHGLLALNGSSVGNLLSGDATRTVLTMSTLSDLGPGLGRRSRDFLLFFVDPYSTTRIMLGMLLEIGRELWEARRQETRGVWPRIDRRGAYVFLRAVSCILLHELAVELLVEDMARGVAVTFADLVSYDEVAHHAGPERPESLATLERIDRALADLQEASATSARPYRIVLLSDHGQSQGATFRQRHGATLEALIRDLMAGRPTVTAATASVEGWGPLNAFLSELVFGQSLAGAVLRRGVRGGAREGFIELGPRAGVQPASDAEASTGAGAGEPPAVPPSEDGPAQPPAAPAATSDLVVCASGNLALVYFPQILGRASLEAIESRHPGLLESLAGTAWVGFVMVRTEASGAVVLGPRGLRWLADGRVEGDDPLAGFGPHAVDHLRRLDGFATVGDLVVNSAVDPATGEVAAFEELVGSHGGLGGPQTQPFLLCPVELSFPAGELVGAPAVGAVLRAWVLEDEEGRPAERETGASRMAVGPA